MLASVAYEWQISRLPVTSLSPTAAGLYKYRVPTKRSAALSVLISGLKQLEYRG